MSVLKTKEVRTVFHFSMSNRFKPLQDQLENNDTNIDTITLMECGKTHVRKSSAEKRLNTANGFLLIP